MENFIFCAVLIKSLVDVWPYAEIVHLLTKKLTVCTLEPRYRRLVNSGVTYRLGIVDTSPSVIPPIVVDGINPHSRRLGVRPCIIR